MTTGTFTKETRSLIELALREDLGEAGDVTSNALIPEKTQATARVIAKEDLRVCGLPVAELVFQSLSTDVRFEARVHEGEFVSSGALLATVSGSLRALLAGERTALNFLQRLSGIATKTATLVATVPPDVKILDTRKTTPGLRELEKYAVRIGGGTNHRIGLYDMVLIKNNHIDALNGDVALSVRKARDYVRSGMKGAPLKIEVEVRDFAELESAISAQPDIILLDNMNPEQIVAAVNRCRGTGIKLEASGGINESNLKEYASTGVDYISLGALTHSVRAADIAMRLEASGFQGRNSPRK